MQNYIDKMFFDLISEFKEKSYEQIYQNMVDKFNNISNETKLSITEFLNKFGYWGRIDLEKQNYEMFRLKARVFKNHFKDFVWLYNKLEDKFSKYVLFAVINNYYNFDFLHLFNAQNRVFKQYFDLDVLPDCKNKVFVDVGSYTGDSVFDYIFSFGNYKKIYCYEITKSIINISKSRLIDYQDIIFRHKAVGDKYKKVFVQESTEDFSANRIGRSGKESVDCVTLDLDIKEKVDIIKMDIEGEEKKALLGAKKHIREDIPILLIAVYHGNTDLYKIPRLISKLNKNYKFYLRYSGGNIFATEIDLLCVPKSIV